MRRRRNLGRRRKMFLGSALECQHGPRSKSECREPDGRASRSFARATDPARSQGGQKRSDARAHSGACEVGSASIRVDPFTRPAGDPAGAARQGSGIPESRN